MKVKPDIVDTLQQEGIELRIRGRSLWGRCPLHEDKTPSFKVDPDRQTFHCFGCNVHGDVIEFIRRYRNLNFHESIAYLGVQLGHRVQSDGVKVRQRELRRRYKSALAHIYNSLCIDAVELHRLKCLVTTQPQLLSEDDTWLYAELMGRLALVDYRLDILLRDDDEDKFKLFKEMTIA